MAGQFSLSSQHNGSSQPYNGSTFHSGVLTGSPKESFARLLSDECGRRLHDWELSAIVRLDVLPPITTHGETNEHGFHNKNKYESRKSNLIEVLVILIKTVCGVTTSEANHIFKAHRNSGGLACLGFGNGQIQRKGQNTQHRQHRSQHQQHGTWQAWQAQHIHQYQQAVQAPQAQYFQHVQQVLLPTVPFHPNFRFQPITSLTRSSRSDSGYFSECELPPSQSAAQTSLHSAASPTALSKFSAPNHQAGISYAYSEYKPDLADLSNGFWEPPER
ncbi:hypothetical protein MMC09_001453 [Bachmanniomyces sp. S44760]|nr:hypothetical protein [Bachmanniomyces sp. S44760]